MAITVLRPIGENAGRRGHLLGPALARPDDDEHPRRGPTEVDCGHVCFVDDFRLYTRALGEETVTTTTADPHASEEDVVIEVLKDFPDNVAAFACRGHLTKADYETVLIPVIEDKLKRHKKLRSYTEIAPDFTAGIESGAFWEETKFGFSHLFDWERSALVTDVEWMKHAAKLYTFLSPEGSVRSSR